MSLIDVESVPRRTMTLFFLADTSGSMSGNKIGALNDAITNIMPMISEISNTNPDAEIKVAALQFSSGTSWLYDEPKSASDFIWQDQSAGGLTSLGEACIQLEKVLHRDGFMKSASGSYAPVVILLSDGGATDDYDKGIEKLKLNNWFKAAIKIAIAIGDDCDKDELKKFTGNLEAVIEVHNIEALKQIIRIVAVTSSQIGSKSTSATDATKQDQVVEEIKNQIDNVDGANTAADPSQATDDYWD
ncbi:MAG: VWA domain-containing protein [Bacteroidaceae bacterium]|nr:VWA domain-containing protein [Bacteroidaceae bacterium]